MHKDFTRREKQTIIINKAIKEGTKQVTLRLYSSEARKWRDQYNLPVSPSPEDLPKDVRKKEYTYSFDISSLKDEI